MAAVWTHVAAMFSLGSATMHDVAEAVRADKCTRRIDVGQKHGSVFSTCGEAVKHCRDCKQAWVVKLPRAVESPESTKARVLNHEALVHREITVALANQPTRWRAYSRHVVGYVHHYTGPTCVDSIIVSQFVPHVSGAPRNLRELIMEHGVSRRDMNAILVQVFMTLEVVRTLVPGFVHMDLLLAQVFLQPWPRSLVSDTLPVDESRQFVVDRRAFWPVIGDFGTSVTDACRSAERTYRFSEFTSLRPAQDIFRFFVDLKSAARGKRIAAYVEQILEIIFQGQFYDLVDRTKHPCMYLPASVAETLEQHLPTYMSVVQLVPGCYDMLTDT